MNNTLMQTLRIVRAIRTASEMKARRNFLDLFADRIRQAATEPTLLRCIERLASLVDAQVSMTSGQAWASFLAQGHGPDAVAVLHWLRHSPKTASMISVLKDDDSDPAFTNAVMAVSGELTALDQSGQALCRPAFGIGITATCLSPLAHGGDEKSGNATLFRRMDVLTGTGSVLSLPSYSGNAMRGQLRDLLADHMLRALGLTPRRDTPPVELWFFHCLYAGGALEERSEATKAINKLLGTSGGLRTEGLRQFRDTLPGLSLLGTALGNRVLPGRMNVCDMRPQCKQWGTGTVDVGDLMTWEFLTRREDHEEHKEHHGMIATTECLKAGTVLEGGIDPDLHASECELGALAVGLTLLQERGMLGAENRRGLGNVQIEIENLPDPEPYIAHLRDNRKAILEYLIAIKAAPEAAAGTWEDTE